MLKVLKEKGTYDFDPEDERAFERMRKSFRK
jgi:hypothetical protein